MILPYSDELNCERFSVEHSGRSRMVSLFEVWNLYTKGPIKGVIIEGWAYAKNCPFGRGREDMVVVLFWSPRVGSVWFHFGFTPHKDGIGIILQ